MALYLVALGTCAVAAFIGAALSRRLRVVTSSALGALGCLLAMGAAVRILLSGTVSSVHEAQLLPMSGASLTLDPLGAWFVLVSAMMGAAACVYNVGYARGVTASRGAQSLLMTFTLSLLTVPAASNIMTFMFAWELMAVSSLLLILTDHVRRPEARSAALWYGTMTQLGAASILLGLLLTFSHVAGQEFATLSDHSSSLSPLMRSIAFVLVLAGFASKAGAVPLHVWLPKAHPEAPSPVSALMSSAMVALGVYGIIRVGEGLLHGGTVWWWIVVALLGVASALYGALHASTSTDLKRLLAYSTIDIIGLVLLGVGVAGALRDSGQPAIADLAMSAALLLVFAHAAFKGALFLAAGAVERATGTRDLDSLGGLIHVMPQTTLVVAMSAGAIMAVPTLSGFSSEWLLLQALLHGLRVSATLPLIVMLLGVISLALTGGLTAVAFVKTMGVGFLGRARSAGAAQAREVTSPMVVAMLALALPSVVIGVLPGLAVPLLNRASTSAIGHVGPSVLARGTGLQFAHLSGMIAPADVLAVLVVAMVLVSGVSRTFRQRTARRVEAWGCGRDRQTMRMQYSATSFAEPLQRVFANVLRPQSDVEVTHVAESRFNERSLVYENRVTDVLEDRGYRTLIVTMLRLGRRARGLQNGSLDRYLAFGFVALLIILVAVG